jgi:hypothetical protein
MRTLVTSAEGQPIGGRGWPAQSGKAARILPVASRSAPKNAVRSGTRQMSAARLGRVLINAQMSGLGAKQKSSARLEHYRF